MTSKDEVTPAPLILNCIKILLEEGFSCLNFCGESFILFLNSDMPSAGAARKSLFSALIYSDLSRASSF